jgi:hypothetical protein
MLIHQIASSKIWNRLARRRAIDQASQAMQRPKFTAGANGNENAAATPRM